MGAPYDLSGKTALVTGGTRGIGRAIAEALGTCGARVVVSSRKVTAVEETVQALRDGGASAEGIAAHVGRSEDLDLLVRGCMERFGGIDILVNNAATNPVFGPVEDTSPEVFTKLIDVNLRAPFELARRFLPSLRERGGGAILNISSVGGLAPERGLGIYSVTKAALLSLTQVMAREWGAYGIRANVICPGYIKTDFSEVLWSDAGAMDTLLREQPIARLGTPEDVAQMAVFLVSPAASFCTGGVYVVDGGYSV